MEFLLLWMVGAALWWEGLDVLLDVLAESLGFPGTNKCWVAGLNSPGRKVSQEMGHLCVQATLS